MFYKTFKHYVIHYDRFYPIFWINEIKHYFNDIFE